MGENFKGVGSPTLLLVNFIFNRHCPGKKSLPLKGQ
jgi:hypothetical protein